MRRLSEITKTPVRQRIADNKKFDRLYECLKEGAKESMKELRSAVSRHDNENTDALLLYGMYFLRKDVPDIKMGLSYIREAALRKNDRAAFILGFLNETGLLFQSHMNHLLWYEQAAERGYFPAVQRIQRFEYDKEHNHYLNIEEILQGIEESKEKKRLCLLINDLKEAGARYEILLFIGGV